MALELAQQVLLPYSHPKSPASSLSSSCGPALNKIETQPGNALSPAIEGAAKVAIGQ
jgi:hypothetical protein